MAQAGTPPAVRFPLQASCCESGYKLQHPSRGVSHTGVLGIAYDLDTDSAWLFQHQQAMQLFWGA
jgi:hypothetical protein